MLALIAFSPGHDIMLFILSGEANEVKMIITAMSLL